MHYFNSEALLSQQCYSNGKIYHYVPTNNKKAGSDKLLIRTLRFCIFGIILPLLLLIIPIHLRFNVFTKQLFSLSVSDMKILDKGISTLWCQKQTIYLNTTFNAYLLNRTPQLSNNPKKTILFRRLQLTNGAKQYWGFYLLEGSVITVSSCSRLQRTSLIVISGYKHLQQCMSNIDKNSQKNIMNIDKIISKNDFTKRFLSNTKQHNMNSFEELDAQSIQKINEANRKKSINIDNMIDHDKIVNEAILKKLQIIKNQKKLDLIDNIINSYLRSDQKREIKIKELNENDESNNYSEEVNDDSEEVDNDSDDNDSDDKSSEEIDDKSLNLNCSGLILDMPLIAKNHCTINMNYSNSQFKKISQMNSIIYSIPKTGYYFFLFNNNNDDQNELNDIVIKFEIDRKVYNLSETVRYQKNVTNGYSQIPLTFFSNEKMVLEIPFSFENEIISNDDSIHLFDSGHDFFVWSDCEPRASVYIVSFFSIIILIILFAFD